jgi:hypothetical protein
MKQKHTADPFDSKIASSSVSQPTLGHVNYYHIKSSRIIARLETCQQHLFVDESDLTAD